MTPPPRVLMMHNRYRHRGGEDVSFEADVRLLRDRGHTVDVYEVDNRRLESMGSVHAFLRTVWSMAGYRDTLTLLRRCRPSIMHVHNTFPLLSPSVLYAAARCGVPVVQKLSNYRLLCPNALFLRDGVICEACLGRSVAWPSIRYACYRDSRPATAAVVTMLWVHRLLRSWQRVARFITLSEFARRKFIEGGFPPQQIMVRANFLSDDPGVGTATRRGVIFVGMLHPWKGAHVLLDAWRRLGGVEDGLTVIGSGPEAGALQQAAQGLRDVTFTGRQSMPDVYAAMRKARLLVFPSVVYETFGRTLIEAFACGTPVIASRLGPAADIVAEGQTGLFFRPGDAADLAAKLAWARQNPEAMQRMGVAAREAYETRYTSAAGYRRLMTIYGDAMASRGCAS